MGRRGGESGDHQEEAEKGKRTHTAQAQGNRREGWRSNREATQTGDSTLREGQLGSAPAVSQAKVDGRQLQCRARLNTSETRQRMGRLTDTKVRGFMVTETNNDACAQLQPVLVTVLTHAGPLRPRFELRTAGLHQLVAVYPKLVHFYRFP